MHAVPPFPADISVGGGGLAFLGGRLRITCCGDQEEPRQGWIRRLAICSGFALQVHQKLPQAIVHSDGSPLV